MESPRPGRRSRPSTEASLLAKIARLEEGIRLMSAERDRYMEELYQLVPRRRPGPVEVVILEKDA